MVQDKNRGQNGQNDEDTESEKYEKRGGGVEEDKRWQDERGNQQQIEEEINGLLKKEGNSEKIGKQLKEVREGEIVGKRRIEIEKWMIIEN